MRRRQDAFVLEDVELGIAVECQDELIAIQRRVFVDDHIAGVEQIVERRRAGAQAVPIAPRIGQTQRICHPVDVFQAIEEGRVRLPLAVDGGLGVDAERAGLLLRGTR